MWKRRELKTYAKGFLKQNYWATFFAVLISLLLTGGALNSMGSSNTVNRNINNLNDQYVIEEEYVIDEFYDEMLPQYILNNSTFVNMVLLFGLGSVIIGAVVMITLLIMVGFVVDVGKARFFINGFKGDVDIKTILSGFNQEEYMPIVKAQFRTMIYLFMWTLLFIIPGIVKSYSYRYVPYVLADDSSLSPKAAIKKSIELTRGHKFKMFILDLSFIGYRLLNLITFGVASYFTAPYIQTTNARLYYVLANKEDLQSEFLDFNLMD